MAARSARGLLLLVFAACAGPAEVRYQAELERTPAAARHGVHSERLEQHMRGLERLAVERLPKALDRQEPESLRRSELVEVARALAASADRIVEAAEAVELEGEERREFLALVGELRWRTQRLADDAPRLPVDALRIRAREVQGTCHRCHDRFRVRDADDGG